ncbi:LOW QUALITY PROTEIN: hypothetical protein MKX08_002600 [Trichoderma sp. CBMAI-0020]|nr:LOW QUALITY PROTEIN: hypothetical protein MKX08_002600 [Trichoderma sp. CBMAI-0020]
MTDASQVAAASAISPTGSSLDSRASRNTGTLGNGLNPQAPPAGSPLQYKLPESQRVVAASSDFGDARAGLLGVEEHGLGHGDVLFVADAELAGSIGADGVYGHFLKKSKAKCESRIEKSEIG